MKITCEEVMKISNHFQESSQKLSSHMKNQEHYTDAISLKPTKPQSEWINLMRDQLLKTSNYQQQKKQLKPCETYKQSYNAKLKSALDNQPRTTTGQIKEKMFEFKTKKPEESSSNWKPWHRDWDATSNFQEDDASNDGRKIAAAIRDERERVKREETRAEGPMRDPFHGTEGAVGLVCWFEKMENTFEISECAEVRKVKFATATLHGQALTWWNSQVATLGHEVANARSWAEVKQMMTDEFCPTEEVQRLEDKLRHLKLRDMNIVAYTKRFNELALLCPDAIPNKKKKVELYIK
nr:putative reverse transcriptase domain-containing protein [Tanacetum cinerariifolium]